MKKLLVFLIALVLVEYSYPQEIIPALRQKASALVLNPGATIVQDADYLLCTTSTSCTDPYISPTTSGSVWLLFAYTTAASAYVSGLTGGSATCTFPSNSHITEAISGGGSLSWGYCTGGASGTTSITMNWSAAPNANPYIEFLEVLPPSGYAFASAIAGNSYTPSCTTCTGPALSTTSTATIINALDWQNNPTSFGNPWGSGYQFGYTGWLGIATNAPNGNATTFTEGSAGFAIFSTIALQWNAAYTTNTPLFNITQVSGHDDTNGNVTIPSCSAGVCTMHIQSTSSGHLLFLWLWNETTNAFISSITDSGSESWVVPAGCKKSALSNGTPYTVSCAYVLSSASGVTTLTLNEAVASGTPGFAMYEVSRTGGSFVFDASAAGTVTNGTQYQVTTPALTITGTNDLAFQTLAEQGGPVAGCASANAPYLGYLSTTYPSSILDANADAVVGQGYTGTVPACVWINPQTTETSIYSTVAFK